MILFGKWKNTVTDKILIFSEISGNELSIEFEDSEFHYYEKYRIVSKAIKKIKISSCASGKHSVIYILTEDQTN